MKSLIFEWQNAVFSASIVFWLIYLLFVMNFGVSDTEVGPDFSHDLDHDMDIDHDIDHDMDHDLDHDTDHDLDIHHGVIHDALSFLGVGRCPLSIVLMVLGITWGFIGLCCNGIFSGLKFIPAGLYFWPSVFVATILGLICTRYVSLTVARLLPRTGSSAVSLSSLVGKHGEASFRIDVNSGRARVRDDHGTLHNIYCKTEKGDEPIPENGEIIVVQYIPEDKVFLVKRKPDIPGIQQ